MIRKELERGRNMFKFVGADIVREKSDKFQISYIPSEENANSNGFVQGGISYLLCDEAVGRYVVEELGRIGAASEGSIHYYRPAIIGEKMIATLNVRKIGKKLGIFFVELTNEAGKLIADAMFTVAFADEN